MAKDARITFEGEGEAEVMNLNFPVIGKVLSVPIWTLYERHGENGYRHGMKQRFGDLGALPKELSDREKEQEHFERAEALLEHLSSSDDWRMSAERDTTGAIVEALVRMGKNRELLLKAIEHNPDQVKGWRANAKVKAMVAKIKAEKAAKAAKEADAEEIEIEVGE